MKKTVFLLGSAVLLTLGISGCSDKLDDFSAPEVDTYFPTEVGKFIIYDLDSTVPGQFGTDTIVRKYAVKEEVNALLSNENEVKTYRIYRHITDQGRVNAFRPENTFAVINNKNTNVQKVEDNLKYIKVQKPVRDYFEWPGNSYINSELNSSSPYAHLYGWKYRYENVGQPFTVNGMTFDETITIVQKDYEELPEGPFNPNYYKSWNYSVEVYAKNVGMIYKHFAHLTWQVTPERAWEDGSFRVIMKIKEHN